MDLHSLVATALGLIAACLAFASDMMKNMLPLRVIALAANVLFIGYFYMENEMAHTLLHAVLLPVNAWRLWDIHKLVRDLKAVNAGGSLTDWLVPHMTRGSFKAGDVLFRKGDEADEIVYITHGQVRVEDTGRLLGPGELLGEIGVFAPDKRRTHTVVCETDGELFRMSDEMLYRLYFHNPKLGFYVVRLIVQRLIADLQRSNNAVREAA